MATHKCNKEGELATMAEKINHIEKTLNIVNEKLDEFILSADKKYVRREEMELFRDEFKTSKSNTMSWVMWVPPTILTIIMIILSLIRG